MQNYVVSLKLDDHLTMHSQAIEAENEKEAVKQAKDYFAGIFGKGRVDEALKNKKNVSVTVVEKITEGEN